MKSLRNRVKLPAAPERAFFYFLTFVFTAVFIQVVATTPAVRQPLRLAILTLLLIVHIAIHWQILWLEEHPRWVSSYVIGQGAIALAICLLSGGYPMIFALYMALIGQVVGIYYQKRRTMAAAIGYYVLLSLLSYVLLFDWNKITFWALSIFPTALFVYIYVSLYSRQAQAREQAQSLLVELEAANKQLTEYAARVEDLTIAAERQRMARELHDTLSQGLAGIILQLEAADAHLANSRLERARAIIKQAMLQARDTLAESRRAIDDLRTASTSEDNGRILEDIAHQEIERFTATTGVPCALEIDLTNELPEAVIEIAQRIIQESLANIARHAQAAQASLRLVAAQDQLIVEVCDDGRGFDPQSVESQSGHYGLIGMRERVRLAGGTLQVHSTPGKGSRILLHLPLAVKG